MESDATDPASIAAMPEWRVSSRLDLHALWRHPPADPAYRTRPVFSHPVLNRSVVAKFNMREDEARRDLPRRLGATKLLLPLQQTRGTLIAKSLVIVPQTLETTLQAELDYRAYDLSHDVAMLQRLDWLPSLDPYVLGEMGRHFQLPFGDCYLQVPRAEQEAVAARVLAEVAPRLQWQLGLSDSPGPCRSGRRSSFWPRMQARQRPTPSRCASVSTASVCPWSCWPGRRWSITGTA